MGGTRSRQIYSIIKLPVKYTVRKISELTNIPKSSIHRLVKAILKRNGYQRKAGQNIIGTWYVLNISKIKLL